MTEHFYRRSVAGLVFLMAFVPFVMSHHDHPVPTFYEEWVALALGIGLVVLVAWRQGLAFGPAMLSPLVFLAVTAAQFLAGRTLYSQDVISLAICSLWGILVAAALVRFFRDRPAADLLPAVAAGLLAGGAFNGLATLVQLSIPGVPGVFYTPDPGVFGNIAHRNLLVTYSALAAISGLYLAGERRVPLAALVPALGAIAFTIVVTAQRSGLLYLIWVAASLLLVRRFGHNRGRLQAAGVLAGWLVFWQLLHPWLLTVLPGLGDALLLERFRQAGLYDNFRVGYLRMAWTMFAAHPLLGAGLGSWDQWVFWQPLEEGTAVLRLSNIEHAHNIVAHLGAELGVAALVPPVLMLWVFWRFRPADSGAGWWVWCVAGVFVLHSLIEYPLWFAHFLAIFVIALGVALGPGRWVLAPTLLLRGAMTLLALAFAAASVVMIRDYHKLETYPHTLRGGEISRAFMVITDNPLLGHHARAFLAANMNPAPVRLPEKVAICRRALAEYADAYAIRGCAAVYRSAGLHDEADRLRERMLRNVVYPGLKNATY